VNDSIEHLQGSAVQEAPVETGLMRARTFVSIRATPRDLKAELVVNTPYAAAQHEGQITYTSPSGKSVTAVFRNHPRGGKKKFVSDPLKANVERYRKVIAARVKQAIEG
jgi:hypothetical protein